jgi:hypothetical protein
MAPFVFRCPNTGLNVHGWSVEEIRSPQQLVIRTPREWPGTVFWTGSKNF